MKKVVLIGDSIRMGYQSHVQTILADSAEVWAPEMNGGDSRHVLANLNAWLEISKPDIVHINSGLHDLKTSLDTGLPAVPLAEYRQNVQAIMTQIKKVVPCVVWATTTPVNTAWHHAVKEFDRFENDVVDYNTAAQAVARTLAVPVNDLYHSVMMAERDRLLSSDGVHFTREGYILLAVQVAENIIPYLS